VSVPACEYQPGCPGCPRFGESDVDPQSVALLQKLADKWGGVPLHQFPGDGPGYRHRSRLSVRGRTGALSLGIFEAGSHKLVPILRCPVHHPAIQACLPKIEGWLNEARIEPYDEIAHTGLIRAVQLAVEPATSRVQVVFLLRDMLQSPTKLIEAFGPCVNLLGNSLSGLFLAALPHKNNSLVAERFVRVAGHEAMRDSCGGEGVFFPPDAFGQANPVMHARAVDVIHGFVEPESEVVEYYSGVGTIGLGLLARARKVVFNEVAGGSLRGLRQALSTHPFAGRALVAEGRAGDHVASYNEDCVVIVDPPRKGLDGPLLGRFLAEPPRRVIYLSCGLDSFLREAEQLQKSEKLSLGYLAAWGYFPYTRHVETLAVLDRVP
jgi:23S rRNA (uracil1939-C5)-methyltransferase